MSLRIRPVLLAAALLIGSGAHATTIMPALDGTWYTFDVDDLSSTSGGLEWIDFVDGSALTFELSASEQILMTVVDAGFAGDRFLVNDDALVLGQTSAVANSYPTSIFLDFDAALASGAYSQRSFVLAPGSHRIGGRLSASALDDLGNPINATVGAVRFARVPAPETGIAAVAIAGLLLARRRRSC